MKFHKSHNLTTVAAVANWPYMNAVFNLQALGLDPDDNGLVGVNQFFVHGQFHELMRMEIQLLNHPLLTPHNGAALLAARARLEIARHSTPNRTPRNVAQDISIRYQLNDGRWVTRRLTYHPNAQNGNSLLDWRRMSPDHILGAIAASQQSSVGLEVDDVELHISLRYDYNNHHVFGDGLCGYIALVCGLARILKGRDAELCRTRTGQRAERQQRAREDEAKLLREKLDMDGPLEMPQGLQKFVEHEDFRAYRIAYITRVPGHTDKFRDDQVVAGDRYVDQHDETDRSGAKRHPGKTIFLRYFPESEPPHIEEIPFHNFKDDVIALRSRVKNRHTYTCPHCFEVVQDAYNPSRRDQTSWRAHPCQGGRRQCEVCKISFAPDHYDEHISTPQLDQVECLGCGIMCFGMGCLNQHTRLCQEAPPVCEMCKMQHLPFEGCDWPKCFDCTGKDRRKRLRPGDVCEHRHFIKKPTRDTKGKSVEHWAFDIETPWEFKDSEPQSKAESLREAVATIKKGAIKIFRVGAIRAAQLDGEEEVEFIGMDSMAKFKAWIDSRKNTGKTPTFWSHNGSRFDTRFVIDGFVEAGMPVSNIQDKSIFMGTKAVDVVLGKPAYARFRDFYLHASAPLAALPGMYGIKDVKKGHFPHEFFHVAHFDYSGPMPGIDWYGLGSMKGYCTPFTKLNKKVEYEHDVIAWHEEESRKYVPHTDKPWVLLDQLRAYLVDDVRVLKLAMLCHRELIRDVSGLDPLLKPTQASVAMECWRYSHMPPDSVEIPRMMPHAVVTAGKWANMEQQLAGCYQGGNVCFRQAAYCVSQADSARGVHLIGVDKVSLYPSVMYNRLYPTGKLVPHDFTPDRQPTLDWLKQQVGAIKCRLWYPSNREPPLFPRDRFIVRGKLCHALTETPQTAIPRVRTLAKFLACVEQGYEWDAVEWVVAAAEPRTDLFNSYITGFYRIKTKCGGLPDTMRNVTDVDAIVKWCQDEHKASGVDILEEWSKDGTMTVLQEYFPEWFEDNGGLKSVAKLMLNSLYGKFGEKREKKGNKFFDDNDGIQNLAETDPGYLGMFPLGDGFVGEVKSLHSLGVLNVNVLVAAYVTDYGMLELNKKLEWAGEDVLYHDTDSVFMVWDPAKRGSPHPETGDHLGEWSDDVGTTTCNWKRPNFFVSIGKKSYALAQTFDFSREAYEKYLQEPDMDWFAKRHQGKPWEEFERECREVPDAIWGDGEGGEVFMEVLKIRMKGVTMNGRNARLLTFRHMWGMAQAMMGNEEEIEAGEGAPLEVHYQSWRWNRPASEFTIQDTRKVVKASREHLAGRLTTTGRLLPFGAERFEGWKNFEYVN